MRFIDASKLIQRLESEENSIYFLKDEELDFLIRDTNGKLRRINRSIQFEEDYWNQAHLLTNKALNRDKLKNRLLRLFKEKERRNGNN